ncbi:hypothetical protein CGCSCA4_v010459 [Colletotrichum siamense]|uniref:Diels-Alderase N-terminal domain-containing protein n=1 Tax=Colletotrichum siamense TaxID=690259 RepID=A0A9P5K0T1_COLSI|nr:hypothetical protein CGCSCA4_v010459 [Colletotrichum siamense]KAF4853741.1 hypothetical protein CGCSCA2_v009818 [Colletotrichum siamense]
MTQIPKNLQEQYQKLRLSPTKIEKWEDGLRTDPSKSGVFEWWYFDSHLANGAKLMVVFHTKIFANPNTGLDPRIQVQLDTPDGRSWAITKTYPASSFNASMEECNVTVNGEKDGQINFFRGSDLNAFQIHVVVDDLTIDVQLISTTSPWRPGTGHVYYDEDEYFAWLVAVPQGKVTATYRIDGEEPVTAEGDGYHDRNWGNVSLAKVINHWYWGRGTVGPYTVISSATISSDKLAYAMGISFMIQKNDTIVAEDAGKVVFTATDVGVDEQTGRSVAGRLHFEYRDNELVYTLEYVKDEFTSRQKMGDGWYLRFAGTLRFKKYESGKVVEEHESRTQWDSMWFGQAHRDALMYQK